MGKRLLQLIPILIGLTFLVFTLLYIAPGDPAQRKLTAQGVAVSEQVLEQTREEMGLNRPFLVRYGDWLLGVLRGDFGASYKDGMPVLPKLMRCMGNTLVLAAGSLLLALVVSVPLGVLTAARRGGVIDRLVRLLTFVGNAMPNFLVSVLLMYYLCIRNFHTNNSMSTLMKCNQFFLFRSNFMTNLSWSHQYSISSFINLSHCNSR